MAVSCDDAPIQPSQAGLPGPPDRPEIREHETRNLWTLAVHQIAIRIGWTFKTETIIIPAFLDTVSEAGWLRGCLPLVRNLGQSVPPLLAAETLKRVPLKKWAMAAFAILIGLPYLLLGGLWLTLAGEIPLWIAGLFMVLYFAFFVFYGLYQLSFATVQGKLIRPTRRGQLLWGSTFWGLFPTVALVWLLMPDWLRSKTPGYGYLFLYLAGWFVVSAAIVVFVAEPRGIATPTPTRSRSSLREVLGTLRRDANLRRLVTLIMLSGIALIIIPHYQNYAKTGLGLTSRDLVLFVITHTTSVTIYSLFIGPLADAWGNRLTLRALILGAAVAPAYAVMLPRLASGLAPGLFWLVFVPLGLTPIVPTILFNYALELCEPTEHPRYLSIVALAMMPPYLLSPLVGKLVDVVGFEAVSVVTCVLMLFCGVLTFWLDEPRHEPTPSVGSPRRVTAAANPPPPEPRTPNPEP